MHLTRILRCSKSHLLVAAIAVSTILSSLSGCGNSDDQENLGHEYKAPSTNAATANDYPLTTCVVSGEDLTAMGEYVAINFEGREVRFCCNQCVKVFKEQPAKYMALLDNAVNTQTSSPDEATKSSPHDHSEHKH